jgi:hypothetical protein
VRNMAYVRREAETIKLAYSVDKVWNTIPKALTSLGWNVEHIDETAHRVKAKTKTSLIAYGTTLLINATPVDEKNTEVSVGAETPVTTITALIDFGQTRKRIEMFLIELQEQLS